MTGEAIQSTGLNKVFDDIVAVEDVSLAVGCGEVHALIGLNGSGKTTLMRMALGMIRPDTGSASILGEDVFTGDVDWTQVGHMIETPFAYGELSVKENLHMSAILHGVERDAIATVAGEALDRFGLSKWTETAARKLSLGNRQKLALASVMLHEPKVLILDEPGNALDPAGVVLVRELLEKFASEGAASIVSSHHLDQVAMVADRVWAIHRGRLVGELDTKGVDLERRFFEMIYQFDVDNGLAE